MEIGMEVVVVVVRSDQQGEGGGLRVCFSTIARHSSSSSKKGLLEAVTWR